MMAVQSVKSQKSFAQSDAEKESGVYKTVEFRMYCFKVLPCSKRFCHDWTNCPFAHPGEKARRRDPRLFHYKGIACPEEKNGHLCPRGSSCPYAHNVFEYWLHPNRYRTQPCNDGPRCVRKVCFFAHTLDELRVPNEDEMENHAPGSPIGGWCQEESVGDDVYQLVREASYDSMDRPTSYPFQHQFYNGLDYSMASDLFGICAGQSQSYWTNSMVTSHTPMECGKSVLDEIAEKPHHLEKALTDLLNEAPSYPPPPPPPLPLQPRLPLTSFSIENYDTRALESGLQWNGGPAKLFVERQPHSYRKSNLSNIDTFSVNCPLFESATFYCKFNNDDINNRFSHLTTTLGV